MQTPAVIIDLSTCHWILVRCCRGLSTLLPPSAPPVLWHPSQPALQSESSPERVVHPWGPYSKLVPWTRQEGQLTKVTRMQWVTHSVCPQVMDLPSPTNHQGCRVTPSRGCGSGVLVCPSAQPRAQTHRHCWHNLEGTMCQFPPLTQKGKSCSWWDLGSSRSLQKPRHQGMLQVEWTWKRRIISVGISENQSKVIK